MSYCKDIDYQELIDWAARMGDFAGAAEYEQQRNEKIQAEGLDYKQTHIWANLLETIEKCRKCRKRRKCRA